jgi:homoserine dehydrogenase
MPARPALQLVLVGAGRVGRRLLTLLDETADRLPFDWTLVGMCSRSRGGWFDPLGIDPRDLDGPLGPPELLPGDGMGFLGAALPLTVTGRREGRVVVVETTVLDAARGEPATTHVRLALDAGAHVVTANKGPAAFAWHDLAARAEAADRAFLFESAVMDGVPVFSLIADALPAVRVSAFRGVVNTTCGYVLAALERGERFADALAEMQRQGIAEADPSLDIDGWDAAAKAAVLANALLDARITPHDVVRRGIGDLDVEALARGRADGRRLRLVASGRRRGGRVEVEAAPVWLTPEDPLAGVSGLENALYLATDQLGEIGIVQRDGGLTQTAYGLVADLARVSRRLTAR